MFKLILGTLEEEYPDLDAAMIDCFNIYPDADFSNWNEDETVTWMDIFENNSSDTVIGKIVEVIT